MFDHLSLGVSDFERSAAFYDAVLAPLGFERGVSKDDAAGYGPSGAGIFWIGRAVPDYVGIEGESFDHFTPPPGFHLAFQAESRSAVDAFYRAAIGAGAGDNGSPGLRPHYGPHYYAAFVLDPDGYRIEAVFDRPVE